MEMEIVNGGYSDMALFSVLDLISFVPSSKMLPYYDALFKRPFTQSFFKWAS